MADTKISALTAVTGNGAASDEFVVNASGSTKKTTLQKIVDFILGRANDFTGANTHAGTETHSASVYWAKGADITCAATLTLGTDGNYFDVSGSTGPVTAISTAQAGTRILLQFDSTPTLTHNATSLILLGGQDITVAAGTTMEFVSEGSGNWRQTAYNPSEWTAYTPTVTASAGTITTASAVGRYVLNGKTCTFTAVATITTNGTGAVELRITLPFTAKTAAGIQWICAGREGGVTGVQLQGYISSGATYVVVFKYDNTYPGADGYVPIISGSYEIA